MLLTTKSTDEAFGFDARKLENLRSRRVPAVLTTILLVALAAPPAE
jgi:hypothetical protein